jgi:predicted N-acyltransferase
MMFEARVLRSIHEVDQAAWDSCFIDQLECHAYLAAVEDARLAGFAWRYVVLQEGTKTLAAIPAFFTDYALDTTLTALGRDLAAAARRLAPRAFTVRLASLGSPCTEDVGLGFHTDVAGSDRPGMLRAMLAAFETAASAEGCWLLAVKDADGQDGLWTTAARSAGYQSVPGMPSATLEIDFADMDGYLAKLSAATRKDMRRKLKSQAGLRIEHRDNITGLEERVLDLYNQTRQRSNLQFEDLTEAYFTGVLERLGKQAFCILYFIDNDLIGFNLLLHNGKTLLDKFFCMETARGPAQNLYFISWFVNLQFCLQAGLARYQSGQAGYETKLRLGSRMTPTQMYFRHRRPLVNLALRWAAPLLADDPAAQRRAA